MKTMTPRLAAATYRMLVEHCGAPNDDLRQASFVAYFTRPAPGNEYRIEGDLGFGGKFRFPRFTVDCYPEDETPGRRAAIEITNKVLADLLAHADCVDSGDAARRHVLAAWPNAKLARIGTHSAVVYDGDTGLMLGTSAAAQDVDDCAWQDASIRLIRKCTAEEACYLSCHRGAGPDGVMTSGWFSISEALLTLEAAKWECHQLFSCGLIRDPTKSQFQICTADGVPVYEANPPHGAELSWTACAP